MSYKTQIQSRKALDYSLPLNYLQSCPYPRRRQALLSIKPEFAEEIFTGRKKYEFRRSIFKQDVDVVVVYVTSPIMRVVGEFDIKSIINEPVDKLWKRTKSVAGIDEKRFVDYFSGKTHGYALEIGNTRVYNEPLDLKLHFGIKPPQSYMYLNFSWPILNQQA